MQRFRNILVGVDLSCADRLAASELNPPTREAIKRATWLAERLRAKLTFFSAIDVSARTRELLQDDYDNTSKTVEAEARAVLSELAAKAAERNIEAEYGLVFGRPWIQITERVMRAGHDLVIAGTRDLGTLGRMLFGSTGVNLLRNCPCPVWITKPDQNWDDLNILIASDLSDVAQDAVAMGVSCGQLADGKVHLLHVVDHADDSRLMHTGVSRDKLEAFHKKAVEDAEHKLHEQLSFTDYRTIEKGVKVHVVEGRPETEILAAIERNNIDLLVMGTLARGGIPGMLVGNTAERLIPELACSILAVKPPDFQCPIDPQ